MRQRSSPPPRENIQIYSHPPFAWISTIFPDEMQTRT